MPVFTRLLLALVILLPAAAPAAPFASGRISVRSEGKGPDVVLIPGLTSSPSAWAATVKAVPGYRYHLIQVKGFAGTRVDGNASGPVIGPIAEEIARYIGAEKLKAPALVGHSMGGTIALAIAARHPQVASRVMVVDMLPFLGVMFTPPGQMPSVEIARPAAEAIRARMLAAKPAERAAQLTKMTSEMVDDPVQRPIVVREALASDPTLVANAYAELLETDLGPELPKIAVPTTVLYVTPKGVPFTDAQFDGFYKLAYAPLKGAKLVRVPASAHFIMSDNPTFFREQLKALLK